MANPIGTAKTLPKWGRRHTSDSHADSPWARKVILSLDGGGVRGYSSLLILEHLMEEIKRCEKGDTKDFNELESSLSCPWTDCTKDTNADFLMHHYVDYFVGTSTGGLTAIMLGRLKMTIASAMNQYNEVGKNVFKKPRPLGKGKFGKITRTDQFDGTYMDETLKKATLSQLRRPSAAVDGDKNASIELDWDAKKVRLRDPGLDSARTCSVVVACTVEPTKNGPWLFRSYDHPYPNPNLPPNELNLHLNAGPAPDVALWKAGRATSAAPGFFPSIQIGSHRFQDGAMAEYNNPIDVAFNEVKQTLPGQEPSIIISIGTGRKQPKTVKRKDPSRAPSRLTWIKHSIAQYKQKLSDSEGIHEKFLTRFKKEYQHTPTKKPVLFRFNVKTGFAGVKLGDWKGKDGLTTREAIRVPTVEYCKENQVQQEIKDCAKRLVEIRRKRAATARWESFALGARLYYICPRSIRSTGQAARAAREANAPGEAQAGAQGNGVDGADAGATIDEVNENDSDCMDLRFDTRVSLRQHAIDCHGYVWPLRCGCYPKAKTAIQPDNQMTPDSHFAWCCIWDHCETEVSAFDEEIDFSRHLKSKHGFSNPRVHRNEQEFEAWLDLGRVVETPEEVSLSPRGTFERVATWESRV